MPYTTDTSPIKLLIVEDFHAETEALLRELSDSEFGFSHVVTHDETAYKQELVRFGPDVILSPYSLKKTNAVKLLGIAREHGFQVPFILLAYDLSEDIAIDLLGQGMEDYVLRSTVKRLPVAIKKALQRHKTQTELEHIANSLKLAQSIAQIGSWDLNPDTHEVTWSDEMFSIHGIEKQALSVSLIKNLTHPDDVHLFEEGFAHVMDGRSTNFIYRIKMPDGTVKHVRGVGRVIRSADGAVRRISGTVQNVTERVLAQQQHEAHTTQKDLILNTAKIGVWHWGIGDSMLVWDERCAQLFDNNQAEIRTEEFYELIHPDDRESVQEALIHSLKQGDYSVEYRLKQGDRISYVLSRGRATFGKNGRAVRIDGILIDMTEQHRLEAAQQETEQLFRDMAENISEVFWLTDWKANKVLYISPQYEALYGLSPQSLYKDGKSWTEPIHEDDEERIRERFATNAPIGKYDEEYRLVLKDGSVKWVRDRAFPIFDEEGNVSRIAGITEEITERKKNEEQLKNLLEDLKKANALLKKETSE